MKKILSGFANCSAEEEIEFPFSERGMFSLELMKVSEYEGKQPINISVPAHWAYRSGSKLYYFDFHYDAEKGKWFHVSDGLNEEFNAPENEFLHGNWFIGAIERRNAIRAEQGLPLIPCKIKQKSEESAKTENDALKQKQEELIKNILEKEDGKEDCNPVGAEKIENEKNSISEVGTLLFAALALFILGGGAWLLRKKQK